MHGGFQARSRFGFGMRSTSAVSNRARLAKEDLPHRYSEADKKWMNRKLVLDESKPPVGAACRSAVWGGNGNELDYYEFTHRVPGHCDGRRARGWNSWKRRRFSQHHFSGWHNCHERDKFERARQAERLYREIFEF